MKKKTLFLTLMILLTLSLACSLASSLTENQTLEEEVPAAEATVAQEATPNEVAPPATDGPCNNILYPLLPRQQMIYRSNSSEGMSQTGITVASVDGNFATMDMLNLATGITSEYTAECESGAIKNYPTNTLGSLMDDMVEGTITMDYVSGYVAPAEKTFIADNWTTAWTTEFVMNGEITVEDEGESVTVVIENSPVVANWQIAETGQTITVEAGTYTNAIKVTREMTAEVKLDMGIMQMNSTLFINSTHWFEPYIGMVKMEINEVNVEAQGMTFPVALDETMELIEFRPAE
ncbi:MAG: hypothetical protein HN855_05705 [Anaerolineae bacterium]|jgi:hypothetical protein|nr:hypothetical protein [Anaerolineae bacterium]MBT7072755.1 hypothetical protein [Anaerolineae bacterium]MBT7324634.1 hypothetical protein [Anaerolineae bacterium]